MKLKNIVLSAVLATGLAACKTDQYQYKVEEPQPVKQETPLTTPQTAQTAIPAKYLERITEAYHDSYKVCETLADFRLCCGTGTITLIDIDCDKTVDRYEVWTLDKEGYTELKGLRYSSPETERYFKKTLDPLLKKLKTRREQ